MTARGLVGVVAVLGIGAAVAAGLVLAGSPSAARALRLDEQRVDDLTRLAREVDLYWSRRSALPASLDDLAREAGLGRDRTDPETGASYAYRAVDDGEYELCAEFAADAPVQKASSRRQFWAHGSGRQCFAIEPRRIGPASGGGVP